ncbi:MAG: hypothetical protein ACT4N4_07680 [Rhodospirillales bacterium]
MLPRAFIVAVLALAAAPSFAQTQPQLAPKTLPIEAFFGSFSGAAVAESNEAPGGKATFRDTKLQIRPAGGGAFSVSWSTTAPGSVSGQPKVKTTTVVFNPTPKPNVFEAAAQGNPVAGNDFMWARLHRSTLTVYAVTTQPDGRYEMQKWDRTLQGTGMQMVYTRLSDGEQSRVVRARLVKDAR